MCNIDQKTQELVTLAKGGNGSALEQLCRVYGERVRRIIRLRMGSELRSKLESMDLVQDALVSAIGGLKDFTYKNEGDFLRWLGQIAENRIRDNLDNLHADKRDIRKEIPLQDDATTSRENRARVPEPARNTTPSVILSKREELDKLEKAIDKLKPEYREVIIWAKIDGLSYKEIGSNLGKSADAAGHLLLRAMVSLTDTFGTI
jgi:RNA polymerase sigma-70 factor (ECF subfamily)